MRDAQAMHRVRQDTGESRHRWSVEFVEHHKGVLFRASAVDSSAFVICDLASTSVASEDRRQIKLLASDGLTTDEFGELVGLVVAIAKPGACIRKIRSSRTRTTTPDERPVLQEAA